jgi:mono/diheme cytochrome c family protein
MIDGTRVSLLVVAVSTLVACKGGSDQGSSANAGGGSGAAAPSAGSSASAAGTPAAVGGAATGGAGGTANITPAMIAQGDSIFHGQKAGGLCFSCHGPDGKGTPTGPNLTDNQWLDADNGSYDAIVQTITSGVPKPKQYPAPMPPMGGASLTPDQVRAAAAYVYSLSHKTG